MTAEEAVGHTSGRPPRARWRRLGLPTLLMIGVAVLVAVVLSTRAKVRKTRSSRARGLGALYAPDIWASNSRRRPENHLPLLCAIYSSC